ncbi:virulence factor MVIN family protein [Caballeronia cordobensis]|uniref:Virulence factor MVIN family protein n=1 Tax=Caballeronia cordobensis TaxID=1353886 RepID=A0A158HZ91_CABCO|nr:lipid II flippase MurJ [Caballeronia cordobensis]SAL49626.1 virulence factor MVIN family protein [Caballeronia cordobensis]
MLTLAVESVRRRLRGVHQDHKRIARSAVVLLVFVLAGKCIGASKEMAIAYRYGISGVVDAYQLALTLVTWLPTMITNQLSVLLVPALVALRKDKSQQNGFLGELEGMGLVIGFASCLLLFLFWPYMAELVAKNLADTTRETVGRMIIGMAPAGVLSFTICISSSRLQASGRHINTLLECVPAIGLLVFVLAARDNDSIMPLVLGTSIGFVIQSLWLRILARRADALAAAPRLSTRARQWPNTVRSMGTLMIGSVAAGLWLPVDQYFMAQQGDGAIATLGYANRLLSLLLSMGALAISRATLPILSEILFQGDHARARNTALKWSGIMLTVGVVGAGIAYALAPYVIRLLFQKGAFTAEDTIAVTNLFRFGLVQVPFYFGMCVLVQLFASETRYRTISVISVLGFGVKILGNVVLARLYGAQGVLLATGVGAASVLACYVFGTRYIPLATDTGRRGPAD